MLPARDAELVQIVDSALSGAVTRSRKDDGTSWLACRPGCTPCCHGVFKISMLDAERLRSALCDLEMQDARKAEAIRMRAKEFVGALNPDFPGEPRTGILNADEEAWAAFAENPQADMPCPALDPDSGRCGLYEGRPLICRIFGPPIRSESGIGVCELCYVDADEAAILAGQIHLTHITLEEELDQQLPSGETAIAWVLANDLALSDQKNACPQN